MKGVEERFGFQVNTISLKIVLFSLSPGFRVATTGGRGSTLTPAYGRQVTLSRERGNWIESMSIFGCFLYGIQWGLNAG